MGIWFVATSVHGRGSYYEATHYHTPRGWEPLTEGPIIGGAWPKRVGGFSLAGELDDDDNGWREGATPKDAVFIYRAPGGDYVILRAGAPPLRTQNLCHQ